MMVEIDRHRRGEVRVSETTPAAEGARSLLQRVFRALPGVVACGVVDLDGGEWVEIESSGSHPKDFLSYLAMTTAGYFEGDAVRTIRTVLDEASQGPPPQRQIEEITLRSTHHLHFMIRLPSAPRRVLTVVTTLDVKLGLVLSSVRTIAAEAGDLAL